MPRKPQSSGDRRVQFLPFFQLSSAPSLGNTLFLNQLSQPLLLARCLWYVYFSTRNLEIFTRTLWVCVPIDNIAFLGTKLIYFQLIFYFIQTSVTYFCGQGSLRWKKDVFSKENTSLWGFAVISLFSVMNSQGSRCRCVGNSWRSDLSYWSYECWNSQTVNICSNALINLGKLPYAVNNAGGKNTHWVSASGNRIPGMVSSYRWYPMGKQMLL